MYIRPMALTTPMIGSRRRLSIPVAAVVKLISFPTSQGDYLDRLLDLSWDDGKWQSVSNRDSFTMMFLSSQRRDL